MNADPIGQAGGVNVYGYANSDPLNWLDPDGRDFLENAEDFFNAGPIDSYRAAGPIRRQAEDMTRGSGLPGAHNGAADAFRHCVWSCEMQKQLGPRAAKNIGDAHERAGKRAGQPTDEEKMDKKNNEEGRDCGENDPRDCATSCMDKLGGGNLAGPGGRPMPAPPTVPAPPPNPGPIY